MKFVVFDEGKGRWIWELRTFEGGTLARSAMSFSDEARVCSEIEAIRRAVPWARVYSLLGKLYEGI